MPRVASGSRCSQRIPRMEPLARLPIFLALERIPHRWLAMAMNLAVLAGLTSVMLVMLLAFIPAGVIRARLRGGAGLPKADVAWVNMIAFGMDGNLTAQFHMLKE